jgi:hypothetical protein
MAPRKQLMAIINRLERQMLQRGLDPMQALLINSQYAAALDALRQVDSVATPPLGDACEDDADTTVMARMLEGE